MTNLQIEQKPRPKEGASRLRAVIYLRVSTAKQVGRDEGEEGYSLPAQRDACLRKAEQLGAEVVDEYVDRGESAKTADRPEFQRMLTRIQSKRDIDYVILDKVDRFARNRRDDANLMFELKAAGAQLISVKENIDETPSGQLLHAIMAGIAEFYSRNLGTEALKGMTQKAKFGGTPGRAPLGYFNVGRRIEDREVRVVEVDPERAPLIQWAFEAYASGEWTLSNLTEALHAKGLRMPPRKGNAATAIHRSRVNALLCNRYYLGYVTFRGVEYEGRHQPLIPESLFDAVQEVMRLHATGERRRTHEHYLKSTVYCGECDSRLCLTNAKGRYLYFFCLGRRARRTRCTQRYIAASDVEDAVERFYKTNVRVTDEQTAVIRKRFETELERNRRLAGPEIAYARRRLDELEAERRRLAQGTIDGSIPADLAREQHERIRSELEGAQRLVEVSDAVFSNIERPLALALEVLARCDKIYAMGNHRVRRLLNQAMFSRLRILDGNGHDADLREPWATLRREDSRPPLRPETVVTNRIRDAGSNKVLLAAPTGFEPVSPP